MLKLSVMHCCRDEALSECCFSEYNNYYEGEFILYRHKTLPFAVSRYCIVKLSIIFFKTRPNCYLIGLIMIKTVTADYLISDFDHRLTC